MPQQVNCPQHGRQGIGLVCTHIAHAIDTGDDVGFFWGDDTDTARPDAWCRACEQSLLAVPKGEPTDNWFLACDFKVICAACWDHAKHVLYEQQTANPNPYASPAAADSHPSPTGQLACPRCGVASNCLKRYEIMERVNFLLFSATIRPETVVACPACMRQALWSRCWANVISANLLWPCWLLPRTVVQVLATYRAGASKGVSTPQPPSN